MRFQWKQEWTIPVTVGVGSFSVGLGLGYILGRRFSRYEVDVLIEEKEELESEQLQLDFKRAELDREFNHMIQEAAHVVREFKEEGRRFLDNQKWTSLPQKNAEIPAISEEEMTKDINVFLNPDENWDYEQEIASRDPSHPCIIHVDEYFSGESGYRQSTLTYYKGDNILCDDKDVPVYNHERIVGELKFGHGSRDANVVYIRNDELEAEYEVLLDTGLYQVEVLGHTLEDTLDEEDRSLHKFRTE